MNKEQLIEELMQHELKLFRFSVYATFNEEGDMQFALCLTGEKPFGYDIHLCRVGGNPDIQYTYDYIDFCIEDAIDEFYDKR